MKIVALEEHFATAGTMAAWRALAPELQDLSIPYSSLPDVEHALLDLAEDRIAAMDQAGVDVQVLSITTPAMQSLDAATAVSLARASNDLAAETIRGRPDRFQGFATLATPAPRDAARELDRAVRELGLNGGMLFGRTGERNVDHPDFWPIFEAAEALRAPLYLHPQSPLPSVRAAYYTGFGEAMDASFASHGIGWYYETGVQLLRLVLGGVFDRFPDLQIIVGHWGELVAFYLDKLDPFAKEAKLARSFSEYLRANVYVTPSGLFSQRYLRWTIETLGVDRIMFSTDYPYVPVQRGAAPRFLSEATLNEADRAKIAYGNWDRLCAGIRR